MVAHQAEIIVAGHICLDIIPTLREDPSRAEDLFSSGRLVRVGPATLALGGCVANTGIALHCLGASVRLLGKLGDDLLGFTLLESLRQYGARLSEDMVVAPGEATSYTVVLNPPGVDRSFLHCAGANDTFAATNLQELATSGARILHFGYPPLMRNVIADGGVGLASAFQSIACEGTLVSLDMARPDRSDAEETVDWKKWLTAVLPHVDLFLPSFDEILLMLDRSLFEELSHAATGENLAALVDLLLLERLADELIELGAPIVVIKLGDHGLYLQTSERTSQLLSVRAAWQDFDWGAWEDLRALCPCFDVDVVGTTGAGDCAITGLLMALLRGCNPEQALRSATAVGVLCVQESGRHKQYPCLGRRRGDGKRPRPPATADNEFASFNCFVECRRPSCCSKANETDIVEA